MIVGVWAFPGYNTWAKRNGGHNARLIAQSFGLCIEVKILIDCLGYT